MPSGVVPSMNTELFALVKVSITEQVPVSAEKLTLGTRR